MNSNNNNRVYYLDWIRVLACFLVCLIHAPLSNESSIGNLWLSAYNYLASPCIGLFFMVSGALLFPVKLELKSFIKRRVIRIALPLLFWSAITVGVYIMAGKYSWAEGFQALILTPFRAVTGVYWFLYTILGLYLFAPIISPALQSEKLTRYFLLLWGMTLVLPYINAWVPDYWNLTGNIYHPLFEFSGYLGYMVLGYYLRHHLPSKRQYFSVICIPGSILAIAIPLYFLNGRHEGVTNAMLYGYLTVNVASLCAIYFVGLALWACRYPTGGGRIIQDISQKSFGIYLIHILVMREWLWQAWQSHFPEAGHAIQIPAVALATFLVSYAIIKLISLIPGSKYII